MTTAIDDSARIRHERDFHDERYRDDQRAAQDKFYAGLDDSEGEFGRLVDRFRTGQRVLELGCGIDGIGYALAERGVEVVGIDISPVAVEQATEAAAARGLTSVRYLEMNAEVLDFDDGEFDGVIGTAVLHHLDVAGACAEMARVLRPEGRALFIEPLGHNPLINAYRRRTPESRTQYEHPLRREDFSLASRFFEEVDVHTHHMLAILSSPISGRPGGRQLHQLLSSVDRVLLRRVPALRWQAWIAVVEMRRPR